MKVMGIIAENKALFAVHAENEITLDYLEDGFITRGSVGPEFFHPAYPKIAEAKAVFV